LAPRSDVLPIWEHQVVRGRSARAARRIRGIGWAEPHVLADLHSRQRVGRAEFGLAAKAHVVVQRYRDISEESGGLAAREAHILSTRSGEGLVG
jgi:hypothetical protein